MQRARSAISAALVMLMAIVCSTTAYSVVLMETVDVGGLAGVSAGRMSRLHVHANDSTGQVFVFGGTNNGMFNCLAATVMCTSDLTTCTSTASSRCEPSIPHYVPSQGTLLITTTNEYFQAIVRTTRPSDLSLGPLAAAGFDGEYPEFGTLVYDSTGDQFITLFRSADRLRPMPISYTASSVSIETASAGAQIGADGDGTYATAHHDATNDKLIIGTRTATNNPRVFHCNTDGSSCAAWGASAYTAAANTYTSSLIVDNTFLYSFTSSSNNLIVVTCALSPSLSCSETDLSQQTSTGGDGGSPSMFYVAAFNRVLFAATTATDTILFHVCSPDLGSCSTTSDLTTPGMSPSVQVTADGVVFCAVSTVADQMPIIHRLQLLEPASPPPPPSPPSPTPPPSPSPPATAPSPPPPPAGNLGASPASKSTFENPVILGAGGAGALLLCVLLAVLLVIVRKRTKTRVHDAEGPDSQDDDTKALQDWDEEGDDQDWDEEDDDQAWDEEGDDQAWDEEDDDQAWDEEDADQAWDEEDDDQAWDEEDDDV